MEILIKTFATVGGLFVALGLWFAFMAFVRRRSGCRAGKDPLEYMAHGCAGCKGDGACQSQQGQRSPETNDARHVGESARPRG